MSPTPRASGGRAHRARTTWPRRAWWRSLRLKFVIPSVTSPPRFQLSRLRLRRLVSLLSTAFYPFVCKRRSFHEQPPLSQPQIHVTVLRGRTDALHAGRAPREPPQRFRVIRTKRNARSLFFTPFSALTAWVSLGRPGLHGTLP